MTFILPDLATDKQAQFDLFKTLVEEAIGEIYVIDADTLAIVLANRNARLNLGYSFEELSQMTVSEIKTSAEAQDIREKYREFAADPSIKYVGRGHHRRKNGTTYPTEVHARGARLGERSVVFQIVIDQTKSKDREERAALVSAIEDEASRAPGGAEFITGAIKHLCRHLNWQASCAYYWHDEIDGFRAATLYRWNAEAGAFGEQLGADEYVLAHPDSLPHQVRASQRAVYLSDLASEADPRHGDRRLGGGFKVAVGLPVFLEQEVRAVLVFFGHADAEISTMAGADLVSLHLSRLYERKCAEEALAESGERFEAAVRGANVGLWDYNYKADSFFLSDLCKDIIGFSPADILCWRAFGSRVHPEDVAHTRRALFAHKTQRIPYEVEYRFQKPTGAFVWLRIRAQGVWDEKGRLVRTAGTMHDVTEEKEAELQRLELIEVMASGADTRRKIDRALALGRQLLRLGAGVISHISEDQYQVLYAAGDGPPQDSRLPLAATLCSDVFSTDAVHAYADLAQSHLANHPGRFRQQAESYLGAAIFVKGIRFGTLSFWSSSARPNPFTEDEIATLRLLCLWIGEELSRAADLTSLIESDLRKTANLASVGHALLTLSDVGLIEDANPAASNLFGVPSDALRGTHISALMPTAAAFTLPDGKLMQVQARQDVVMRPSGERVAVMLQMNEVRLQDRIVYTAAVEDLTAIKQAETAKREFVSVVSHELRTPLTSIRGALGLLAAEAVGPLPPEVAQLVSIAERNSERLSQLINDILDIDRLENGRLELDLHPIDLPAFLREAISANSAYAARFGVMLEAKFAASLPFVTADANRMMQVMANLLSNAAKFTRPGTPVTIDASPDGEYVTISVTDHGSGIAESLRARLFEKFSQGDHSNTRNREGSGLGLAITKQLVERMNGAITFSTSPLGTTFYVRLPFASSGMAAIEAAA